MTNPPERFRNSLIFLAALVSGCGLLPVGTSTGSQPLGRAYEPQVVGTLDGKRQTGICIALFEDQSEGKLREFLDWVVPTLSGVLERDLLTRAGVQPFAAGSTLLDLCGPEVESARPEVGIKLYFFGAESWPQTDERRHTSLNPSLSVASCSAFAWSDVLQMVVPSNCVEAGQRQRQAAGYVNVERYLSIPGLSAEQRQAQILATAFHEILHLYGFLDEIYHSQNTSEQGENFCDIDSKYPQLAKRRGVERADDDEGVVVTEYDSQSIMNYCFLDQLTQPEEVRLSEGDVALLKRLYSSEDSAHTGMEDVDAEVPYKDSSTPMPAASNLLPE